MDCNMISNFFKKFLLLPLDLLVIIWIYFEVDFVDELLIFCRFTLFLSLLIASSYFYYESQILGHSLDYVFSKWIQIWSIISR